MLAYHAVADIQLNSGFGDALMPGSGLEGAQGI